MAEVTVCDGTGLDGLHCCTLYGEVCQFLVISKTGTPRCSVFEEQPTPEWEAAPVGRWFSENYPGRTCRDWPQNIPEAMALGRGNRCCWDRVTDG